MLQSLLASVIRFFCQWCTVPHLRQKFHWCTVLSMFNLLEIHSSVRILYDATMTPSKIGFPSGATEHPLEMGVLLGCSIFLPTVLDVCSFALYSTLYRGRRFRKRFRGTAIKFPCVDFSYRGARSMQHCAKPRFLISKNSNFREPRIETRNHVYGSYFS